MDRSCIVERERERRSKTNHDPVNPRGVTEFSGGNIPKYSYSFTSFMSTVKLRAIA
jgi:hypothetical protein